MNLEAALSTMSLQRTVREPMGDGSRLGIAKMVFNMAAAQGEPFENMTVEDWAKKWLASKYFTLVELRPNQVAVPYVNRIATDKIQSLLAQSESQIPPIVVDVNKNGIGKSNGGFTPRVIVVDGKHRHRVQVLRGKDRILAWVGDMAMAELKQRNQFRGELMAGTEEVVKERFYSSGDSINQLFAAIAPPTGGMARHDTGDGGARQTGGSRLTARGGGLGGGSGMNPERQGVYAQNARSTGQLQEPDPSDTKIPPDPSDSGQSVDPSDRLQWNPKDPQQWPPGAKAKYGSAYGSPAQESPGSGVGPKQIGVKDVGSKNSELANPKMLKSAGKHADDCDCAKCREMNAGPIKINRMRTKNKARRHLEGYGTSEGVQKEWESRQRSLRQENRGRRDAATKQPSVGTWQRGPVKTPPGINPAWKPFKQPDSPEGYKAGSTMKSYGTSEGVKKEWESRDRGGLKYPEEDYQNEGAYDLGKKGSGVFKRIGDAVKQSYHDLTDDTLPTAKNYTSNDLRSPRKLLNIVRTMEPGDRAKIARDLKISNSSPAELLKYVKGLNAVAPPGREQQVKKLKKKFGTESAFKIAWSQYKDKGND